MYAWIFFLNKVIIYNILLLRNSSQEIQRFGRSFEGTNEQKLDYMPTKHGGHESHDAK